MITRERYECYGVNKVCKTLLDIKCDWGGGSSTNAREIVLQKNKLNSCNIRSIVFISSG